MQPTETEKRFLTPPSFKKLEIHCTADLQFAPKYGRQVKAVGGEYSDIRGHVNRRFVTIPVEAEDLINKVCRDFGIKNTQGAVTMVARETAKDFDSNQAVQYVRPVSSSQSYVQRFQQLITEAYNNIRLHPDKDPEPIPVPPKGPKRVYKTMIEVVTPYDPTIRYQRHAMLDCLSRAVMHGDGLSSIVAPVQEIIIDPDNPEHAAYQKLPVE